MAMSFLHEKTVHLTSPTTLAAFSELQAATQLDDAELIAAALRLQLALLRAHTAGSVVVLRQGNGNEVEVKLFAP